MGHPVHLPLANGGHAVVPVSRIASVDHPVEQGADFCYVQLTPVRQEAYLERIGSPDLACWSLWGAALPDPLVVALPWSEVQRRMQDRDTRNAMLTAVAILGSVCFLAWLLVQVTMAVL